MTSNVKEIDEIADAIRKVLKDEGVYSPLFEMMITTLAQTVFLKDSAFKDATSYKFPEYDKDNSGSVGSSIVVEQSREGFLRYKNNPAYTLFLDYADAVANILKEMTMTAKSSTAVQEDEIDSLKKKVEKAANGK